MPTKPRLLVVDNEIDICNFVKSFFSLRGFDVATALNGDEALERVKNDPKIDIILLDVVMRSEEEGIQYLPQIKALSPSANIFMVTGVADDQIIEKAKQLGAADYITKPLILEYLETTVMEKIKKINSKK